MKIQSYIAILLVSLFLTKFVALDANALNLVLSGSDITFVNPFCKKEKDQKKSSNTPTFSQPESITVHTIAISSQCTPQFQFEFFSWELVHSEPITFFNENFSSRLSYLYLENASPPPRLA